VQEPHLATAGKGVNLPDIMIIGRIFGWLICAMALMALGAETIASLETGAWRNLAIGEIWYLVDKGSLNLSQAIVQRYLIPSLWDGFVVVLQQPAWLVFGVSGPVLILLFGIGSKSDD
jgi:hypothetical protein